MTPQEVVNFLNACLKESEDTWGPLRKIMAECYDRYRSFRDHSEKKKWQHKIVVPTVYPAIKGASGLLRRILMKSDEFFSFVPERQDSSPQEMDPATGKPKEDQMDNFARAFTRKVRFHLDEANYIERFGEAVESALAMMLGIMRFTPKNVDDTRVVWAGVPVMDANNQPVMDPATGKPVMGKYEFLAETKKRAKLEVTVINPLLLHYNLDMSWVIEETRVQLHEILSGEEQGIKYDQEELAKLKKEDYESAARTDADRQRLIMLKIAEPVNRFRREVVLHTFWGTVTDTDGTVVQKEGRFIVANQKYVLLAPSKSPYWLRKNGYVFITPLKVLFMVVGAGMVDGIRPILNAIDNLVNICGDKALFCLLSPSEINVDALKDPSQAEGGLIPGKLFKTKGPLGQALHQIPASDIPQGAFNLLEHLVRFTQNYTGWTEFIQGMPTSRGDVTATEVQRKTEASSLSFENIAASIEQDGVVNAVEMARDMTVQYFMDPALNPETADIFQQEGINLAALPEAEKYAFLNRRYPIKVKGLQAFFDKEKERQDILQAMEVVSKIPAFLARINAEEFLARFFNSFPWPNPEMLILEGVPVGPTDPVTGKPLPPAAPGTAVPGAVPPGLPAPGGAAPLNNGVPAAPGNMDPAQVLAMLKGAGEHLRQ